MDRCFQYLRSSIGRKQIVAVTGLALIIFVLGHLAGNLLIFGGPEVYNAYAKKLSSLRPGLYVIEFGLLAMFVVHMWVTALLVIENVRARGGHYAAANAVGNRNWKTRLMPYTGTLILAFVIWHLMDFTFIDHAGPRGFVGRTHLGLYGIVYNSFCDPTNVILYIMAMFALGFHLAHGIQSFSQTFGVSNLNNSARIIVISDLLGIAIAVAYSSIPVYIFMKSVSYKVPLY